MIPAILNNSWNTEVYNTSNACIKAIKASSNNADPNLVKILNVWEPKSQLLLTAIKHMKTESQLEKADTNRDNCARGVFFTNKGALYSMDDTVRNAAEKVEKILDNYGLAMLDESYASETTLLKSLLEDLSKANLQDTVAAVPGLTATIAQLQEAQDSFSALSDAYEKDKSVEGKQDNASTIRKEVIQLINQKLIFYLKGMWAVDEETYGALGRNIAQIIKDNNENVKKRANKKEEEQEEMVNE